MKRRGKNSKMAASEDASILEQSKAEKENTNEEEEVIARMESFDKLFKMCLDVILSTGSPEQFKKYFKEIKKQSPTVFSIITEQLMNHLKTSIETEINLMIKQEDLATFFNTLDQLVAESKNDQTQAWRPSGDPSSDCRDHLMAVKCNYRDRMKVMLEKIEKENKALEEIVIPKRAKIEENQKQLSEKVQHLREAADLCQELNLSALQKQDKVIANSAQ